MDQVARQNQVLEQVVNHGVALDATQGAVAAWVFLSRHGVDHDMIVRVLAPPAGRRPPAEGQLLAPLLGQSIGQNQTSSDNQKQPVGAPSISFPQRVYWLHRSFATIAMCPCLASVP